MSVEQLPLTVTITNYNYGAYLRRAIQSIQAQTFQDFEIIIVDNASTDNSVEIIKQLAEQDPRIRLITHERNMGLSYSLREACDAARGVYRVHVDADDWVIDPQAFELQIAMLESDPDISLVYSPVVLFDKDLRCVLASGPHLNTTIEPGELAVEHALNAFVINTGPMIRMSAYRTCGGYDTDFYFLIDTKIAVDLCAQGKVGYINRPLYAFYQHGASLSDLTTHMAKEYEALFLIQAVFSGPLAEKIANPVAMRRRVTQNRLTLAPTQQIFAGQYAAGWRTYWCSFRIKPLMTLLQPRTLTLLARTFLGDRGYVRLRHMLARVNHHKQRHIAVVTDLQAQVLNHSSAESL